MMMSRCDAEEDPSQTKKRKQSPSSGLPEEMVLSCLARVSRSEHASLSLVSKRHRSLLTTPELYKFRTLWDAQKTSFIYAYASLQIQTQAGSPSP
uniref:F-box domain-containing protein n=1 Tax=Brassica oleracea TaxID=3712 RepID=A0A3P6EF78_BRAOL|nr:unnamed protein product [Brassica oleracea]